MKQTTVLNNAGLSGRAKYLLSGIAAFALFLIAGCGGVTGNDGTTRQTDQEDSAQNNGAEGFEYGASQDDVNDVIAELEPVTITYQVGATAENSISGRRSMEFKEAVEQRSNGQIEVDIIWGMAIAGYPEAIDAVVDGRVDISYHLVSYEPQRFPEASAIGTALGSVDYSPMVGEMIANAVGAEIGWNDQALLDRYESEGVTPLSPIIANGTYSLNCNSEVSTAEDLRGKQVRAGSAEQSEAVSLFDAVPTSMEFTEAFEALQRGTVDCDLSPMAAKEISGIYEAAPHLAYSTKANFPRFSATYLTGPGFDELPLAYQQILFDSNAALSISGATQAYVDSNAVHVEDLNKVGGTINEFDDEFQDRLGELLYEQQDRAVAEDYLPEGIQDTVAELTEKWEGRIADLGFEDGGEMSDMDEWYDPDSDWTEFAWDVFENSGALEHRPE